MRLSAITIIVTCAALIPACTSHEVAYWVRGIGEGFEAAAPVPYNPPTPNSLADDLLYDLRQYDDLPLTA